MDIGSFVLGVMIGLIYFLLGLAMRIKPFHELKGMYRHRKSVSAEHKPLWREIDSFSANLMMLSGIILILISAVCSVWVQGAAGYVVIVAAAVILAVLMVALVEGRLRKIPRK